MNNWVPLPPHPSSLPPSLPPSLHPSHLEALPVPVAVCLGATFYYLPNSAGEILSRRLPSNKDLAVPPQEPSEERRRGRRGRWSCDRGSSNIVTAGVEGEDPADQPAGRPGLPRPPRLGSGTSRGECEWPDLSRLCGPEAKRSQIALFQRRGRRGPQTDRSQHRLSAPHRRHAVGTGPLLA